MGAAEAWEIGGEREWVARERQLVFGRVRERKLVGEIESNGVRVLLKT